MMIHSRFAKQLAAVCAAFAVVLGWAPGIAAESGERASQLKVAGCEITIDLSKTHSCLEKALDRARRDAEREGKDFVQKQVKAVQAELDKAESQLAAAKKELDRAQKDMEKEVAKAVAKERLRVEKEANKLLKTHAPLFDCLSKEPGFDFAAASNAFAQNPGAFAETQMRQAIAGVRSQWAAVMKAEMAQLASGRIPPRQATAFAPSAEKLARFAQPVPGARCLITHAAPLVQPYIDEAVRDIAPVLEKELRAILNEQILPEVQKGIAAQLREVFKQLPNMPTGPGAPAIESQLPFLKGLVLTEDELREIVRKVLLDRRFAQLDRLLPAVDQVGKVAVDTRSTKAVLFQAQQAVLTALKPTPDWDRFYLQIGVEVVRKIGHKYLESHEPGHGGFLLSHGIGLLQFAEGTRVNLFEAVCGVIPEVGGAACAIIEEAITAAWNGVIVPGIEAVASTLLHTGWNEAMNRVRKQVDSGRPIGELAGKTGAARIDALIGALPHEAALKAWATKAAFDDEKQIDSIFTAIGTLATAAATR